MPRSTCVNKAAAPDANFECGQIDRHKDGVLVRMLRTVPNERFPGLRVGFARKQGSHVWMNRPLNSKRGPHYVYQLFEPTGAIQIHHGNGWRMSRQMREMGCAAQIIESCRTEPEAYELAAELRRRASLNPETSIAHSLPAPKEVYSRDRIQSIVEWNLQSIGKYPADLVAELCHLHGCETHHELTAKLIADCLFYRL